MGITKNRYYEVLPFKLACELAGVPEHELFGVVLSAIGDAPELVGSERLFTLVGILASQLSEDEALEVLLFGLDLFEPSLETTDGDGSWSSALTPPLDVNLSLAGYVWGGLASPHSSIRWEGAHAARALCELGCGHVISGLVDLARGETRRTIRRRQSPFLPYARPAMAINWARPGSERSSGGPRLPHGLPSAGRDWS